MPYLKKYRQSEASDKIVTQRFAWDFLVNTIGFLFQGLYIALGLLAFGFLALGELAKHVQRSAPRQHEAVHGAAAGVLAGRFARPAARACTHSPSAASRCRCAHNAS